MRKFRVRRKRISDTTRLVLCAVLITALCSLPVWYVISNYGNGCNETDISCWKYLNNDNNYESNRVGSNWESIRTGNKLILRNDLR